MILFLDFDGVVHDRHAGQRWLARARRPNEPASPLARWLSKKRPEPRVSSQEVEFHEGLFGQVQMLADLLEPYPAVEIVVHSHWRHAARDPDIADLLGPLAGRFAGTTPREIKDRFKSIVEVVRRNPQRPFRILDDDLAEFPSPPPSELILFDRTLGLRDAEAMMALEGALIEYAQAHWTRGWDRLRLTAVE